MSEIQATSGYEVKYSGERYFGLVPWVRQGFSPDEMLASAQQHMVTNTVGVNLTTVPPPPPPPPPQDEILASAQEHMVTNTVGVNATTVPPPPPPPQRARDGQLQLKHPWSSRDTPFPPLFTVRDERYKWRRIVRTDDDDNCTLSNLVI